MLDILESGVWCCPEEPTVSQESRRQALEASALVHPNPEAVSAALFVAGDPFFFALDKVQVKYEMLRSHVVDGRSASCARHRRSPLGRRWSARSSAASVSRCTSARSSGRGDDQGAVAGGRGGAV